MLLIPVYLAAMNTGMSALLSTNAGFAVVTNAAVIELDTGTELAADTMPSVGADLRVLGLCLRFFTKKNAMRVIARDHALIQDATLAVF